MIEVLGSGALNSVQDAGRPGYLDAGVSRSGVMDRAAYDIGQALVGVLGTGACIEVAYFPLVVRFGLCTVFAVTGADCTARLDRAELPPDWACVARAGQVLRLDAPGSGARAYLSVRGGFDVPLVLGSRATDLKSGFGGFAGRGLLRGDCVAFGGAAAVWPAGGAGDVGTGIGADRGVPDPAAPVRVLPAAEFLQFTEAARNEFLRAPWTVTAQANRQGYRLRGPVLDRTTGGELFSHGIVPGTVQVPPSGQPMIQLAEANTCGGYPKVAAVILADLPRIAQAPVGSTLHFALTDFPTAQAALRDQAAALAKLRKAAARFWADRAVMQTPAR